MTIEEIMHSEDISIRSYNVCKYNGLNDSTAILKFYRENRSFEILRNCGRKSNEELTTLCLKFMNLESNSDLETPNREEQLVRTLSDFTREKREMVNMYIELIANNLSSKSKSAILEFLDGNLKIQNISEKILTNNKFNFSDIKNVGLKSLGELNNFFDKIFVFIEKLNLMYIDKDLLALRNKYFIEESFPISDVPAKILESNSIYSLVDFLVRNDTFFDRSENIIFKKTIKIYDNQRVYTLIEIAKELQLSAERVRQKRNVIFEKLLSKLDFMKYVEEDVFQKYGFYRDQYIIHIDDEINAIINQINETEFSRLFNTLLIYSCVPDQFEIVGKIEDVFQIRKNNSRVNHNWNSLYLVRKEFVSIFDYNSFMEDIHRRIKDTIDETYSFHFKSYLSEFIRSQDRSLELGILPIVEKIVNCEFDLIIDIDENIVFKRNTFKQTSEFVIEALQKLGRPSSLEDIYVLIESDYPEIAKGKESLNASLKRNNGIISFGKSGRYGLKVWEIEKQGIKGGTIKDIVYDYLKQKKVPIHILELLKEVHKFREETSSKSIMTNLKLDPKKRFIVFNQNFIGITGMDYDLKLTSFPKYFSKTIQRFILDHGKIQLAGVVDYFSKRTDVNAENIEYIIHNMIEKEFLKIDNENYLEL
jgi:hypothetical protein